MRRSLSRGVHLRVIPLIVYDSPHVKVYQLENVVEHMQQLYMFWPDQSYEGLGPFVISIVNDVRYHVQFFRVACVDEQLFYIRKPNHHLIHLPMFLGM